MKKKFLVAGATLMLLAGGLVTEHFANEAEALEATLPAVFGSDETHAQPAPSAEQKGGEQVVNEHEAFLRQKLRDEGLSDEEIDRVLLVISVGNGNHGGERTQRTQQPETEAAEPTYPSAEQKEADQNGSKCRIVQVRVPVITRIATYNLTVYDLNTGLVDTLAACNPQVEVRPLGETGRTAVLTVTQGADQWAYFKVPADRDAIAIKFRSSLLAAGEQDWKSEGTLAGRDQIVLVKYDREAEGIKSVN